MLFAASIDRAAAFDSMQSDYSAVLFGAFGALALAFGTAALTTVSHLLAMRRTELPVRIRRKSQATDKRQNMPRLTKVENPVPINKTL